MPRHKTKLEVERKNYLIEAALEGVKDRFPESQIHEGTHTFTIRYSDGEMYYIKVQKVARV